MHNFIRIFTSFIPSIGTIVMASSLHCMLLLRTPANVNQHNLISDWLDTISLKNMLSDKNDYPNTQFTCMLQFAKNWAIYCSERRVLKQDRKSLKQIYLTLFKNSNSFEWCYTFLRFNILQRVENRFRCEFIPLVDRLSYNSIGFA